MLLYTMENGHLELQYSIQYLKLDYTGFRQQKKAEIVFSKLTFILVQGVAMITLSYLKIFTQKQVPS